MLASACALLLATGAAQAAIDAAAPGATVTLPAGTYREHLRIGKPLTLAGDGAVVIDGGGAGTVVQVTAGGVTLRRLVIRGSGDSFLREDAGVKLENADGTVVDACRLEDVLFGLYVAKSSRCRFTDCWIGGKPLEMPRRGDGIRLWYSDGTVIERLTMVDSRDLVIWFARGTVVRGCHVSRGRYGLHYMYCDDNRFEDNVFTDNQVGGTIMYSRRITLTGNRFERSRGPSACGLLLKDADDVLAEGNAFVDNTQGVYFDNSPQSEDATATFRRNLLALNDAGIGLMPSTRRVRFEANTFVDNLRHVEVIGRADPAKNTWIGNFWGDHVAYDGDGDGACDVPYAPRSAYESLLGRHPTLGLFRWSPAVSAIELAGRLFPLAAEETTLTDPAPAAHATVTVGGGDAGRTSPALLLAALVACAAPFAAGRWARRVAGA